MATENKDTVNDLLERAKIRVLKEVAGEGTSTLATETVSFAAAYQYLANANKDKPVIENVSN